MLRYLPLFTWVLALAGAAAALGAMLGKSAGFLGPAGSGRLWGLAYALMGLSMALFLVRGFSE